MFKGKSKLKSLKIGGYNYEKYIKEVIWQVIVSKLQLLELDNIKLEGMVVEGIYTKKEVRGLVKLERNLLESMKILEIMEYLTGQFPYYKSIKSYSKKIDICRVNLNSNFFYKYLWYIRELAIREQDIGLELSNGKVSSVSGSWVFGLKDLGTLLDLKRLKLDYFVWPLTLVNRMNLDLQIGWVRNREKYDSDVKKSKIMELVLVWCRVK